MSEQSIFLAALDISDPAGRADYVAATCGDNEALRKEVEALLCAHERPGAFLDEPAVAQMGDSGGGETRTVVPGANPDFAETRAPDSTGGCSEEDVLAFLQPQRAPARSEGWRITRCRKCSAAAGSARCCGLSTTGSTASWRSR